MKFGTEQLFKGLLLCLQWLQRGEALSLSLTPSPSFPTSVFISAPSLFPSLALSPLLSFLPSLLSDKGDEEKGIIYDDRAINILLDRSQVGEDRGTENLVAKEYLSLFNVGGPHVARQCQGQTAHCYATTPDLDGIWLGNGGGWTVHC